MIDRSMLTANDFIGVRAALVAELGGDAASALVLTRIYFRADQRWREAIERDDHWWWRAPLDVIAEETGLGYAAVRRAVTKLTERGVLAAEKHRLEGASDQTVSYRLLISADDVLESADQDVLESADLPSMQTVEEEREHAGTPMRDRVTAVALAFNQFYDGLYPRKVGRPAASRAFSAAVKRLPPHQDVDVILKGAATFRRWCKQTGQDVKFIPYPATWLNRDGWNDELVVPNTQPMATVQPTGPRRLTPVERNLETFAAMGYDDEPPLPELEPPIDWDIEPPRFDR